MSVATLESPHKTQSPTTTPPATPTPTPTPTHQATGPKTEAGKANSRRNAVKHGLSGNGIILPAELAGRIQARKEACLNTYQPEDEVQAFLVGRISVDSVLIEHCESLKIAAMDNVAIEAVESWELDRKLDAVILFDKLKKRPEGVQRQLLQTKYGCDTLIEAWQEIARVLRKNGPAMLEDPIYVTRIFDLLGIPQDQRTWEQIESLVTDDPLHWVEGQIEHLKRLQFDYLNDRDARDQADAQAGLSINAPKLRTILRYEAAIQRRLQWAINELNALKAIVSNPPDPQPGPDLKPQPHPQPQPQPAPRQESKPAPPPPPPSSQASAFSTPPVNVSQRSLSSIFTEAPADKPQQPIVNGYKRISRKERRRRAAGKV